MEIAFDATLFLKDAERHAKKQSLQLKSDLTVKVRLYDDSEFADEDEYSPKSLTSGIGTHRVSTQQC